MPQQSNKSFQQYQGQQISEIPPGFVEAMGAMGQAYASIGQNIAAGLHAYKKSKDEAAIAKEQVSPYLAKSNAEVNGFKSSGFLDTDANGNVKIAEGKQGMFEPSRLGELQSKIDLYNRTAGGTKQLSSAEYQGIATRIQSEQAAAKADREERLVAAKEEAINVEKQGLKQKEVADQRRAQIEAFTAVNKTITDVTTRHATERKQELLSTGKIDPTREAARKDEINNLKRLQIQYTPDFGNNPTGNQGVQPVGGDQFSAYQGTGFSPNGVRPASVSYAAPGDKQLTGQQEAGTEEKTQQQPAQQPTQQVIRPIPINMGSVDSPQAQAARNGGHMVYKTDTGAIDYSGNFDVLSTSRGDIRRVSVSTEQDFLSTGLRKDQPYIVTGDASGHPLIVANGRMDSAESANSTNMAGMALRFIMEGRVSSFAPTDEQLKAVQGAPIPDPASQIDPTVWKRALVAAGIATGRIMPAQGQDINSLSYGDMFSQPQFRNTAERYASEGAAAAKSVNITTQIVPSKTAMQTRTGQTVDYSTPVSIGGVPLTFTLPSNEMRQNFARAGIPIDAEDERYFDSMDAQAKFSNLAIGEQARIAESLNKAHESAAAAGTSVVARASATAQMASNFGEKVKRYPGALESTGHRFGYFTVELPLKGANQRYTSNDITRIQEDLYSEDQATRDKAYKEFGMMTTRFSAGGIGEEQMNTAATATQNFNESIAAIGELRASSDLISQQGVIADLMTRLGIGPNQKELKATDIRAMFLRGNIRPVIAGPGNPAIYEQEMINATIPNMQSMFSIRSWDSARIKALALVTASGYVERMRAAGFQGVTQDAIDDINAKVKDAYGKDAPVFTREDFVGPNSWLSIQANKEKRDAWLKNRGIATVEELRKSNSKSNWKPE